MKKLITLLSLVLSTNLMFAQSFGDLELNKGEKTEIVNSVFDHKILGKKGNYIYSTTLKRGEGEKDFYFIKWDLKGNLVEKSSVKISGTDANYCSVDAIFMKEHLFAIFSFGRYSKRNDETKTVSYETLKIKDQSIAFSDIFTSPPSDYTLSKAVVSDDKKRIIFVSENKKNDKLNYHVLVQEIDGNKIWDQYYENNSMTRKNYQYSTIQLDADNNAFIQIGVTASLANQVEGEKDQYDELLLSMTEKGKNVNLTSLFHKEYKYRDFVTNMDSEGNIYCSGTYYIKGTAAPLSGVAIKGIWMKKINGKTGEFLSENHYPFDEKNLNMGFTAEDWATIHKEQDKKKWLGIPLKPISIHFDLSGNVYLSTVIPHKELTLYRAKYLRLRHDLVIFQFDSNGKLNSSNSAYDLWPTGVDNLYENVYPCFSSENGIVLLHRVNLYHHPDEKIAGEKWGLMYTRFTSDGKVEQKLSVEDDNASYGFFTGGTWVDEDSFYFIGYSDNQPRMMWIKAN